MTIDEASKVAKAVSTADNGCPSCVRGLCCELGERFPEFSWLYHEIGEHQNPEVVAIARGETLEGFTNPWEEYRQEFPEGFGA